MQSLKKERDTKANESEKYSKKFLKQTAANQAAAVAAKEQAAMDEANAATNL